MLLLNFVEEAVIGAGIWITVGVYKVAAVAFELFLILASGELVSAESYGILITNFYVILGVIMLFVISFSLLKGMVNPDDQNQGTSMIKKLIINIVTSAIFMAVCPFVFAFLYDVQTSVISDYNVIGKFFGYGVADGSPSKGDNLEKVKQGAYQIVNGVYTAFFSVNLDKCFNNDDDKSYSERLKICQDETSDDKYDGYTRTFNWAIDRVNRKGTFGIYSIFTENVANDRMEFNFLLSLVGGLLLIYVGVSYCFDMALRLVKLVFYQMIAPIPIFFRIMPNGKFSDSFKKWLSKTGACYLEVYIRILVFYFCVFLCSKMLEEGAFLTTITDTYGGFLGLLATAFVLMGVVTFMKAAPKLFSEATGIDSGNMSLGIRDKFAAGGGFAAGAILGGALASGARNFTNKIDKNAWAETKNLKGKEKFKERAKLLGGTALKAGTWGSVMAGTFSGGARAGKAGYNAKSFGDMTKAASTGISGAATARDKRASYKAYHPGTFGVPLGHIQDAGRRFSEFIGFGTGDAEFGYYATAAQSTNSFNDLSESTYKKKQEYVDQSSKVKAMKTNLDLEKAEKKQVTEKINELNELRKKVKGKELRHIENQIASLRSKEENFIKNEKIVAREEAILNNLQIEMAYKKKDVVATAATRLSVDQKTNYSNNKEISDGYKIAIGAAFGLHDMNGNVTEKSIKLNDLDSNSRSIFDALMNGQSINDEWITKENVIAVQSAIDNANIKRQHTKAVKEREHIVNTNNRSIDNK